MGEGRDLAAKVREIGDCFLGLNLFEADQALDDVRRFVYALRFYGDDQEAIKGHLKPSEAVLRAVSIVAPLSIAEVEKVTFELRYHLWTGCFARVPNSAFGQKFQAHMTAAKAVENAQNKVAARKGRKMPPKLTVVPGGRLH